MEVEGCSTAVITPKNLFLQFKRHFLQLHLQGSVPGIIDWLGEPVAGILISAATYWRRQRWNKSGAEASPVLTNWMCPWAASGPTTAGAAISSSTREHPQSLQVWSKLAAGKGSTTKGVNQKHFDYRFTRLILKWNNPPGAVAQTISLWSLPSCVLLTSHSRRSRCGCTQTPQRHLTEPLWVRQICNKNESLTRFELDLAGPHSQVFCSVCFLLTLGWRKFIVLGVL